MIKNGPQGGNQTQSKQTLTTEIDFGTIASMNKINNFELNNIEDQLFIPYDTCRNDHRDRIGIGGRDRPIMVC